MVEVAPCRWISFPLCWLWTKTTVELKTLAKIQTPQTTCSTGTKHLPINQLKRCPLRPFALADLADDLGMLPLWYICVGVVISVVTVAGNGLVVFLIASRPRLHGPSNWIILSLAAADLLVGAGYFLTQYLHDALSFDNNLRHSILSFLCTASTGNLSVLMLDRYIFITKPLRYAVLMNTRRAVLLVSSVWVVSFVSHAVFFLVCSVLPSPPANCSGHFMIFDTVVFETLPMLILSFATTSFLCIVKQKSRQTSIRMGQLRFNQGSVENGERPTRHDRNSALKVVVIASTVFVVCSLFDVVYTVIYQFRGESLTSQRRYFSYTSNLLYMVNSAINPMVYAFYKKDIRKSMRTLIFDRRVQVH